MGVGFRPNCMLTAIQFDNQMSIGAKEIDDEAVDGKLPPEFPAAKAAITQTKPKQSFGVSLIAA